MNQNEIDLLFGRICSASEKLHYLRNKLYQFIKVTDDGELTQLPVPLTVVPQHSQVDISNVRIIVTHAYKSQAELLNLVHDDFQVNANLVPLECLVSRKSKRTSTTLPNPFSRTKRRQYILIWRMIPQSVFVPTALTLKFLILPWSMTHSYWEVPLKMIRQKSVLPMMSSLRISVVCWWLIVQISNRKLWNS